jgi:pimeloyl-ACP methyl ester carboxylesterase
MISYAISSALAFGALAGLSACIGALISRAHPPQGRFVEVSGGRLHLAELGAPKRDGDAAIVLIHGASANLEDMRIALGAPLAELGRVILIDRPGRGWSERVGGAEAASPARQAQAVAEALEKIGVTRAILVAHSWGGALALALALDRPGMTAGLVLLAPTTHPWRGGISWYYSLATTPVLGPLFAHTLATPLGLMLINKAGISAFLPQTGPADYVRRSASALVLRPDAFIANARDVAELKGNLAAMAPRYGEIAAPVVIVTGDSDEAVSPDVHARALATALPHARLEILPGVGHMPHHAMPERVAGAVREMIIARDTASANIRIARGSGG